MSDSGRISVYEPPGIIIPYVRFTPVQTLVGGGCLSFPKNPFHVTSMAYGQPVFDYCTRPRYDAAMAKFDTSDNPLKGFEVRAEGDRLFLVCRASGLSVFHYYRRIKRITYLDDILNFAAAHRLECKAPIQAIKTPLIVTTELIPELRGDS